MNIEINAVQLVGIWFIASGLVLNSVIFIVAYVKLVSHLNEEVEEEEDDQKKGFPVLRFIFQLRRVIVALKKTEHTEKFKRIITVVDCLVITGPATIVLGFLMILVGLFI